MTIDSALNLGLPAAPLTQSTELAGELQIVYNALRILQQVLDDAGITGGTTLPSSVIDVAHGGTAANTLTGILKGAGTAAITGISSSTAGHLLKCTGANTYAFQAPAGAGTGDVVGPASAVAGSIVVYDGVTGKLIKDSGARLCFDNLVLPKTSGYGIQVDTTTPTFGWRDIIGAIETRPAAGGGAASLPDFVVYRGSIYQYRFGTTAPNNHLHEAFLGFHIPHDYVPSSDLFIHVHWSQIVVDTGGTAAVPGVAKWYFDISYADGHGTAGGAADPFVAPITVSITQQGSTTQYGHLIAEVQFSNNGGTGGLFDSASIQVDGLFLVRVYRDPTDVADTLNQDTFVHSVDIHYQSTNVATKQKAPNFYT